MITPPAGDIDARRKAEGKALFFVPHPLIFGIEAREVRLAGEIREEVAMSHKIEKVAPMWRFSSKLPTNERLQFMANMSTFLKTANDEVRCECAARRRILQLHVRHIPGGNSPTMFYRDAGKPFCASKAR